MKCSNIRVAPSETGIVQEETNLTSDVHTCNVINKQQKQKQDPVPDPVEPHVQFTCQPIGRQVSSYRPLHAEFLREDAT